MDWPPWEVHANEQRKQILAKLDEILKAQVPAAGDPATQRKLDEILKILKEIKVTETEFKAILDKVDVTTNGIATNVQTIADTDQVISDEMDSLIKKLNDAGVSPAIVSQAQALADRLQSVSDASDAQVAVLKAIAAKGAPVVPPPPPLPPIQ